MNQQIILKANDNILTKRRKRTRQPVIQENRKNAVIQAAIIHEEQIRLKEREREKVKESIEATRRKLEERKKEEEEKRILIEQEKIMAKKKRLERIAAEKARIKALEPIEIKAALNEARRQLKKKVQLEKERALANGNECQLKELLDSKKKQDEKARKKALEAEKAREEEKLRKIKEKEDEIKRQNKEKAAQIRKERRLILQMRFLKKMNEYNIDFTEDRRAIKARILAQKEKLKKKRDEIELRKEELRRMKIEMEQRRRQEEEEIRRRAELESKELEDYLSAAQKEFETNLYNFMIQEEINDAIEREKARKKAEKERIELEMIKREKYKALKLLLEETQRKAVEEYVHKIEEKRKKAEVEAKKTQDEKLKEREIWRAEIKAQIIKLKKEYEENQILEEENSETNSSKSPSRDDEKQITRKVAFSAFETERFLIESFNEYYDLVEENEDLE